MYGVFESALNNIPTILEWATNPGSTETPALRMFLGIDGDLMLGNYVPPSANGKSPVTSVVKSICPLVIVCPLIVR